jgi:AcrR family transcriptional regulator
MTAKKPYHRENLRRDLLDAGRDYVKAHGHHDLSIRTLAQKVGVSPGAPYHHFPDRRSFLLALALDGFENLQDGVSEENLDDCDPVAFVKATASNFVKFSLENPHMLELMYESELTRPSIDPQLQKYQELSHRRGADLLKKFLPNISDREADLRNMALWTSIYGLVSMINKGIIRPFGEEPFSLEEISDWVVGRAAASALAD